jgi:SAM-dependent methyltransferase
MEAVTTCLVGCGAALEPMARWAPYRTCPACGSGFYAPPPAPTYWGAGVRPSEQQDQRWTERARQWQPVVGTGPGRVLDVGCGFGHFVRWAAGAGWDAWGYDPDDWSRQQTVADPSRVVGDLDDAPGRFDVITLWDVLEHAEDPVAFAASLRSRLATGGRLVVCSPDFEALQLRWWWLRRSPQRFRAFVRPHEHVTQFTPRGLEAALGRAGFASVTRVEPPLSRRGVPGLDLLASRVPRLRTGLFVEARNPA